MGFIKTTVDAAKAFAANAGKGFRQALQQDCGTAAAVAGIIDGAKIGDGIKQAAQTDVGIAGESDRDGDGDGHDNDKDDEVVGDDDYEYDEYD